MGVDGHYPICNAYPPFFPTNSYILTTAIYGMDFCVIDSIISFVACREHFKNINPRFEDVSISKGTLSMNL